MDKQHGIKYPKTLAITETTSRQKFIEQLSLFNEDELKELNNTDGLKKTLFSFNEREGLLFDGLCALCMDAYDSEHPNLILKIEKGITDYVKVIERQDNLTETHYRSILSLDEIKAVFCGEKYNILWPYVIETLKQLAYEPPKKKNMILGKKLHIETVPFNIDLIYDDGSSYKFNLKNLSPRRTNKQKNAGVKPKTRIKERIIVGMAIDYYKPLFAPIIEINKKKKPGRAYIVTPPYFQLSILETYSNFCAGITNFDRITKTTRGKIKELVKTLDHDHNLQDQELNFYTDIINNTITKTVLSRFANTFRMTPLDIRRFYLYLTLHDNHKGDYIDIENLIDFVENVFPGLVEKNRDGEKKIYPSRYKELLENYINPILAIYRIMTAKGDMNGGQLVPVKIVFEDTKTGEKFGKENNTLRIECMKSKTLYSIFTVEGEAQNLIEMVRNVNGNI
jgi:hypothetical protein